MYKELQMRSEGMRHGGADAGHAPAMGHMQLGAMSPSMSNHSGPHLVSGTSLSGSTP